MNHFLASLCFLGSLLHVLAQCNVSVSEFRREGDYVLGGLFDIHQLSSPVHHDRPETIDCSSQTFITSNYRRFQVMRFSVEEINNSTNLLPNVLLGYEIFDHCSDVQSLSDILKLISVNGSIRVQRKPHKNENGSNLIAVVGPFSSTSTRTVAPLFMVDLVPMVNYGSSSSAFSEKIKFPSYLRTVHSNKSMIEVLVSILLHFSWRWVAFLNSDDEYGIDGQQMFTSRIKDTEICLAYTTAIHENSPHSLIFKQIEAQKITVIIVFAPKMTVEAVVDAAIQLNVTNKVWIGGDSWSLNNRLRKEKGIQNIGTVLGVSQPVVTIPGLNDFIYAAMNQSYCDNDKLRFCNQVCNCSGLSAEKVITSDPTFSFPVYSAVYAIAHALHNTLQCGADKCNGTIKAYPYMVLAELKKLHFTLLNQRIQFDKNGDPNFGSYDIVYWNKTGDAEHIGFYKFHPFVNFFINNSKIQWYNNDVPTALCSQECNVGYAKKQNGIHKCCFTCELCLGGTYVNITEDPYTCAPCKVTEWSTPGSTSCLLRVVEYIPFTDTSAIMIIILACTFVVVTLAMSVVFAINYNTPIVRSAGGPMCFLILGCLSLCSLSVFFYFDKPTSSFCMLRSLPFFLFYTVGLACFVVRSFQIVCIFKIAAKIPKLHSWWMKYHGQWLIISVSFIIQALLLLISYSIAPPKPYRNIFSYADKIILTCDMNIRATTCSAVLLVTLCSLCFIFSYMGKDLPKNYNEAKSITFCLILLTLTWIIFATAFILYRGKYIELLNALAILSSLYSFLFWYFLPKCHIIIFQPQKNTPKYFQGLIQNYTKTISQ